jgi:hypothetical protein
LRIAGPEFGIAFGAASAEDAKGPVELAAEVRVLDFDAAIGVVDADADARIGEIDAVLDETWASCWA